MLPLAIFLFLQFFESEMSNTQFAELITVSTFVMIGISVVELLGLFKQFKVYFDFITTKVNDGDETVSLFERRVHSVFTRGSIELQSASAANISVSKSPISNISTDPVDVDRNSISSSSVDDPNKGLLSPRT